MGPAAHGLLGARISHPAFSLRGASGLPPDGAAGYDLIVNPPTKEAVVELLESIALMLELKGENPFKVRAYTNAARAIETFAGDLGQLAAGDRLGEIGGIGEAIAEKLRIFITTGKLEYADQIRAEFPPGLFDLFELQGLGAKKIKALWDKLGVDSIPALEKACREGGVAGLPGFGEKTAANILKAIESRMRHAGSFRIGDIAAEADALADSLRALDDVSRVTITGSFRRRKEVVRDLDFLVATKKPEEVSKHFVTHPFVESVIAQGPTKSSVRLRSGIQADLRVVTSAQYPFALNYFTGSKEHNIVMRQRALERGWTLNEYRLEQVEESRRKTKSEAQPVPEIHEECDLYRALGLDYVEPELRENTGEFDAAEKHELPRLVELGNLRGTFHCHTTASDGRSTLDEMAHAAHDLGLEYLGIADHSKSSFQAHGLSAEQLLDQVEKIRALNKTFDGFRIFAGVECDILKDGSLDYPDDVLEQLDYVVASVHSVFNLSEAEMTARIVRAMENPHVTMLGHLTGRLLLSRDAYAVNIPAIIEAAAATGTIIELNANPKRLDMDWRWWPLAKQKGVKCAINPDAHHTGGFQHLFFGIGTARKGWLTKDDVVNCLPLEKIGQVLEAKRGKKM
jgi:DNA polymerase (family X)